MVRTSISPNFNEAHDCSAGIFGFDGPLQLSLHAVMLHRFISMRLSPRFRLCFEFFEGDLAEGDVIIVCDPYFGGSHLPDYTVMTPLVYRR